jgi:hypothetical protein
MFVIVLMVLLLSVGPISTFAGTFWTDPAGRDEGSCTDSVTDPGSSGWLTIGFAAWCAQTNPWTINMRGGTYSGSTHLINTAGRHASTFISGSTDTRNVIQGAPGHTRPIITSVEGGQGSNGWVTLWVGTSVRNYITIREFSYNGQGVAEQAISLEGSNLVVEDCEIQNIWNHAVFMVAHTPVTSASHTIRRCSIHNFGIDGNGYAWYGAPSNSVFEDNEVYDYKGAGIQIQYGYSGTVVRRNYFHDANLGTQSGVQPTCNGINVASMDAGRATAVQIYNNNIDLRTCPPNDPTGEQAGILIYGTSGLLVANNMIYRAGQYALDFQQALSSVNAVIANNHFADSTVAVAINRNGSTFTTSYTHPSNYTGTVLNCVISLTSFSLKASPPTNPCVDTGITIAAVTSDTDETPRPQGSAYDIGPYERLGTTGDVTPPAAPTGLTVE